MAFELNYISAAYIATAGSVRIVPTPELAARDDVNSDHLGMDNLSLADVLTEFDVHLVEALGGTKKSTVLQIAAEKQSETKAISLFM